MIRPLRHPSACGHLAAVLRLLIFAPAPSRGPQFAHEVRPAYLELREIAPGIFDVLFKTPMRGDARLALDVGFSGRVERATPVISRDNGQRHGADLAHAGDRAARRPGGADRRPCEHYDRRAGARRVCRRQRMDRAADARCAAGNDPAGQSGWAVAATYLRLGVEHILLGYRSSALRARRLS